MYKDEEQKYKKKKQINNQRNKCPKETYKYRRQKRKKSNEASK